MAAALATNYPIMKFGMLYAASAYVIWGLFPLYFKILQSVSPLHILIHRVIWSLAFLVIVLALRRQWSWVNNVVRRPKVLAGFAASALLLSANWFLYIWAVNQGRIVDASLGYFMTPLVNVLLGFALLHERLRAIQWGAIGLAVMGVAWLTWLGGSLPWISLILALSFGTYGLLRKTAALGALEGLTLESAMMFPAAVMYLGWLTAQGQNSFSDTPLTLQIMLIASGPITAIPLLLFASGARRIPLSLLGLMQYVTPSLQLLLGVWLYHEPFGSMRLIGFVLIWSGLAVFSAEGVWRTWSARLAPPG